MEDITDEDHSHAKRSSNDYEIKCLGEYLDLYVQSDTLLLPDVFGNFRNMSWNIWAWSCKFSLSFWISMASSFKKVQSKIISFNWYWSGINCRKRY